jgi:hypothetical protein
MPIITVRSRALRWALIIGITIALGLAFSTLVDLGVLGS